MKQQPNKQNPSSILRSLTIFFTLFAITIGTISTLKPELYLKVPKIGFLLYAILGGKTIPGYIDNLMWENEHLWAEPGDVIVSVPAKSGTTWTFATVHQIRNHGVENYTNLLAEVPWLEFSHYPGQTLQHRVEIAKKSKKHFPFKVFKSHKAPPIVKYRADAKYIVVIRDIMQGLASFRPFLSQHDPVFCKLWGDFPDPNQTDEQYAQWILKDVGNGKERGLDAFFLDVIAGWWPYRNKPNVLFLHYDDRLKDPEGDVDRMAKFLNVKLTAEEKQNVIKHSSFKWMKEHEKIYAYGLRSLKNGELGPYENSSAIPETIILEGAMVVKGGARDTKEVMYPAFYEEAKKEAIKRLGKKVYEWVERGGSGFKDIELEE
jgi:hypothetical protein